MGHPVLGLHAVRPSGPPSPALLFVYYTQFISPQTTSLTSSAEVLLMVIAGGPATLLGPIVGAALVVVVKNVVSGYIVRWNLLLGAIFVAHRHPDAGRPGARLCAAVASDAGRRSAAAKERRARGNRGADATRSQHRRSQSS